MSDKKSYLEPYDVAAQMDRAEPWLSSDAVDASTERLPRMAAQTYAGDDA